VDINHLCRMANQIGQFYRSLPNRAEGLTSTATHIRRFWDPRMRRELLAYVDATQGAGLDDFVMEAIRAHRELMQPGEQPVRS
jgi:formate dehydrogenase subunit delta